MEMDEAYEVEKGYDVNDLGYSVIRGGDGLRDIVVSWTGHSGSKGKGKPTN